MKGVILGICRDATIVDISHEIKPFDILSAAFTLGQAYPCFPVGTIHIVVVDPGVGGERRPLLVEADGHRFVGPDNGVFSFALDADPRFTARRIDASRYFRHPVSTTFHGRDIFAPVAAHLACGVEPTQFGGPVRGPARLNMGKRGSDFPGLYEGIILSVDRFGNLVTSFRLSDIPEIVNTAFEMHVGMGSTFQYREVYSGAPAGALFVISGSSGYLEVSINQGDAATVTGAAPGTSVFVRLPDRIVLENP
jgi:S-adenosylmethionine hydrolase